MSERTKFIPEFKMPSAEALRQSSLAWYDRIGPTLIDQWPKEVAALSMPTKFIPFPLEIAELMFEPLSDGPRAAVRDFARQIDSEIGWSRKFARLNSRSPKDATWPFSVPATLSGKEVISMFSGSERILDDLCYFQHIPEHPAFVCLRDWVFAFWTECEFRCFVKDGELIAVTHYDYTKPWSGPEDGGKEIRADIDAWFAEQLKPNLHIDTVVFDIHRDGRNPILLIELNPYGLSDPCHFKTYAKVESASSYVEFAPPPGTEG